MKDWLIGSPAQPAWLKLLGFHINRVAWELGSRHFLLFCCTVSICHIKLALTYLKLQNIFFHSSYYAHFHSFHCKGHAKEIFRGPLNEKRPNLINEHCLFCSLWSNRPAPQLLIKVNMAHLYLQTVISVCLKFSRFKCWNHLLSSIWRLWCGGGGNSSMWKYCTGACNLKLWLNS